MDFVRLELEFRDTSVGGARLPISFAAVKVHFPIDEVIV